LVSVAQDFPKTQFIRVCGPTSAEVKEFKNIGNFDKIIRTVLAIAIIGAYVFQLISGMLAIVLLVIAGIFVATSFIGFCPIYLPFGISSCKVKTNRN
jgi:hypothetical protein